MIHSNKSMAGGGQVLHSSLARGTLAGPEAGEETQEKALRI